ncbi:predicted protein [Nematostella vectensis]|uniref:VWFC domain-containing protein n=1 Tax=Nematostella vectensis TaxID=45351 RepID=A7RYB3_NEMVE|nr:predicted protein [Nematostella vectensis]|eukprot:XP_001635670.1 predicted protein [Nematostella vectensis]
MVKPGFLGQYDKYVILCSTSVTVSYEPVGCFADTNRRALRNEYYNYRRKINWNVYPDFSAVINNCARQAYLNGFRTMFAVQFWGECWSDGSAFTRFMKYGPSSNCAHGVGKHWANYVYHMMVTQNSVVQQCTSNGKVYNEGDTMYVPNEWLDVKDAACQKCECNSGKASSCSIGYHCDALLDGACEKYVLEPKQCCPTCVSDAKSSKEAIALPAEKPPPTWPLWP